MPVAPRSRNARPNPKCSRLAPIRNRNEFGSQLEPWPRCAESFVRNAPERRCSERARPEEPWLCPVASREPESSRSFDGRSGAPLQRGRPSFDYLRYPDGDHVLRRRRDRFQALPDWTLPHGLSRFSGTVLCDNRGLSGGAQTSPRSSRASARKPAPSGQGSRSPRRSFQTGPRIAMESARTGNYGARRAMSTSSARWITPTATLGSATWSRTRCGGPAASLATLALG